MYTEQNCVQLTSFSVDATRGSQQLVVIVITRKIDKQRENINFVRHTVSIKSFLLIIEESNNLVPRNFCDFSAKKPIVVIVGL